MSVRSVPTGLGALCLVAVAMSACSERATVLAEVDSRRLEIAAFQQYLGAVASEPWEAVDERVASRLLDQYLDQEVVAAVARGLHELPVPVTPSERSAMVRRLLPEVCGEPSPLPEDQVAAEVERRRGETGPARARVRQMLLRERERAVEVRVRLADGDDWVELSRRESRAANAAAGGDLGILVQGTLPEELDQVIFSLDEGEISEPVESSAGFHIFQVLDAEPAGVRDPAEVAAEVRRELGQSHVRAEIQQCIEGLAAQVGVEVYRQHLWFEYDGRYAEGSNDRD